jgi:hypothetical protein
MKILTKYILVTSLIVAMPVFASESSSLATGCSGETSSLTASHIYYVSPDGSSTNSGTSFSAAMDFKTALATVQAGEMILLKAGTYNVTYTAGKKNTLTFSKSGSSDAPIYVATASCGRAVFNFNFPTASWVQDSFGFYVTGNYWYFKGIDITNSGYHGAYVIGDHNTFENMAFYKNRNTGLEINKGGANNLVLNSDAYLNYDPKKHGSMADGFGAKQEQGAGNQFIGCRAWQNSDDGFDLFDTAQKVVIKESWAFLNGIDYWSDSAFAGNGNGFKLGGNSAIGNHAITRSIAFGNVSKGFDQNNNTGGVTVINNTAYSNGINYGFGGTLSSGQKNYFRNNISLSGTATIKNADSAYNTWNSGFSVTSKDFENLTTSLATAARNKNGSLPANTLFQLKATSELVDAGVVVDGISYEGNAPDLGAFELK